MGRRRARHFGKRNIERDFALVQGGSNITITGLNPVKNAKAFGAVGDGATSDVTALAATDTAAAGSQYAWLPPGEYYVDSDMTLAANWLISPGATFNIEKFSIRSASYQWTASGSGTSEYYLEASGGGDPSIVTPTPIYANSSLMQPGRVGDLSANECGWDDNDSLGYYTVYVRLSDSTDPDTKAAGYVEAGHVIQVTGSIEAGAHQIVETGQKGIVQFPMGGTREIYPEWFGAVGDAEFFTSTAAKTDDAAAFLKIFMAACDNTGNPNTENGCIIKLTRRYVIGQTTTPALARFTIAGTGRGSSGLVVKNSLNDYGIRIEDSGYLHMENFTFDGNRSNNTTGGCLRLKDMPVGFSADRVNFIRAAQYCAYLNDIGQTLFTECIFNRSDLTGCRVGNATTTTTFITCTFEDNDTIGVHIEGSNFNGNVHLINCHFENNAVDGTDGDPRHIVIDSYQSDEMGGTGNEGLIIEGCYIYGIGDTSNHIGATIDGNQIHGIHIRNNIFRDCGGGAVLFNVNSPGVTNMGFNTILHNQFTGTTPHPAISTSTPEFEPWGFMMSDHTPKTIITDVLDLTSANTVYPYWSESYGWWRIDSIRIRFVTAATASETINIGYGGGATYFSAFATPSSSSAGDVINVTFSGSDSLRSDADTSFRINNSGTANAGTVQLLIKLYDWSEMPVVP